MESNILIGLGTGQCGFAALKELFSRQPQTRATLEDPPLLPWESNRRSQIVRERLERFQRVGSGSRLVVDIAAFYLPYVAELVEADPSIRCICLQAPVEQVVRGFENQLDSVARVPTDHWSKQLAPGWYHDPLWSRTFPTYEVPTRAEGIETYYREYYEQAASLAQQFPDNFILRDSNSLSEENAVQELLSFAGIPEALQMKWVCPSDRLVPQMTKTRRYSTDRLDPRRCVVLVPFGMFIHQDCDQALKELERRGYQVRRVGGYAAIDQGRNQMATDALLDGFEETFWIDSDVGFHPDDVEKIRRHDLPIVCGIYPQKGKRALACHVAPNMPSVTFGEDGGLVEILYAGAGFLNIRREAYQKVQEELGLPMCNERFGSPMIPFFHPHIRQIEDAHWYLAEDYAFCERARSVGLKTYADTSVRLWHTGNYRYGWEDAGMERPRYSSFTMNFRDIEAPRTETSRSDQSDLQNLAARYPWPDSRPSPTVVSDRVWLLPSVRQALSDSVQVDDHCIVELGCWIGRTSRYLAELASQSRIVCLDPWDTYPFAQQDEETSQLYGNLFETFLAESWDFQDRIVPMRRGFMEGLHEIADSGIEPNLIFFNAITDCPDMLIAITAALDLFPKSTLLGHCLDRPPISKELEQLRLQRKFRLDTLSTVWRIASRN